MRKETSQQKWVRRTRESVLRAIAKEGIPVSAGYLEDCLDITTYYTGLGFVDRRSQREVSAALRYLVTQGHARRLDASERDVYDPPGTLYECTPAGFDAADRLEVPQR